MNTPKRNYNSLVCFLTAAFIIFLMITSKTDPDSRKAFLAPQYPTRVIGSGSGDGQASQPSQTGTSSAAAFARAAGATTVSVFM